jgi:protocatechuate 3,4-dioxygenase beta subunit
MRVHHREAVVENHDLGLDHDLPRLLQRRGLLQLVAGAALIPLAGCATAETPAAGDAATTSGTASATAAGELPEETAGPFPGDGSNGANILARSGVVRSDITSSFGDSTTKAAGVPLSIAMTILDFDADSAPLTGAAVYVWHCSMAGEYSLYSSAIANENYLRGVQQTDAEGKVTFTSIFPAAYRGRWPHIHFEVYPSLAKATNSQNKIATSQLALPEATANAVYATAGYEESLPNMTQTTLASDMVFGDGYDLQLPTVTGNVKQGYALQFSCAV